jgi:hypothetical protein
MASGENHAVKQAESGDAARGCQLRKTAPVNFLTPPSPIGTEKNFRNQQYFLRYGAVKRYFGYPVPKENLNPDRTSGMYLTTGR